jgi:hypothetical protein
MLQASGVNDPTARLRPDRERAIRRALKGLCDRNLVSTLGTGRPGDPYRYTLARVCKLCDKKVDEGQRMLTAKAGWSVCAQCASTIAHGYLEHILAEPDTASPTLAPEMTEEMQEAAE